MPFQKRNVPLSEAGRARVLPSGAVSASNAPRTDQGLTKAAPPPSDQTLEGLASNDASNKAVSRNPPITCPGVRPSPLDGRPTTSSGTPSVDQLLAGHAGLPLGHSILIEEQCTTDYGSALLRFFAAEGVLQGHAVHVVGVDARWARDLPGVTGPATTATASEAEDKAGRETIAQDNSHEKMKIAWRYERLGEFGTSRVRAPLPSRIPITVDASASGPNVGQTQMPFCHAFDLTRRLTLPSPHALSTIAVSTEPSSSPFAKIIPQLAEALSSSSASTVHRLLIPGLLLSPTSNPFQTVSASRPNHILTFLQQLRALLRAHPTRLVAMLSLPLHLYPRTTGLTRWIELLSDGVIELVPFPHPVDPGPSRDNASTASASSASATAVANSDARQEPQGLVRVHRLPVFHERGGGSGGDGSSAHGTAAAGHGGALHADRAFILTRRRFAIVPFTLPPLEGDTEAQHAAGTSETGVKVDLEF